MVTAKPQAARKPKAASKPSEAVSTRSRIQKIGVKPGMRVAVMGLADPSLSAELAAAGAIPTKELADLDLLFYAADDAAALARIEALVPMLSERGALWIVSKKGKLATVKDVEVTAAAKARGLIDNKVVAFSATQTSLRFTLSKAEPGEAPGA
ncbi:MAG TPA: hypothetical protein VHN73_03410 [Phenylobacterium sp.]|nr:hypothetical protein [Phenylobacterium sp.]